MARSGLYQLISWTLMAMKMMKGACRKHSSCPFLLALLVEHCGTHRSFIVHVSGSSFKSHWHLVGWRLWEISHRLLRSQLCCLVSGSSRLEIVTLLPNAETIYSQMETFTKFRICVRCYLPDFPLQSERSDCCSARSIHLWKRCRTESLSWHAAAVPHLDTFEIWIWSSTHAATNLDSKSTHLHSCIEWFWQLIRTWDHKCMIILHHYALTTCTEQCRMQITLANNPHIHHMEL